MNAKFIIEILNISQGRIQDFHIGGLQKIMGAHEKPEVLVRPPGPA